MKHETELTNSEVQKLEDFLVQVHDGSIQNAEGLDGFIAAMACCPELIMPSEYLPVSS